MVRPRSFSGFCDKTARMFWGNGRVQDRDWPALMVLADKIDPSFRN
jgi:hypothetical protein